MRWCIAAGLLLTGTHGCSAAVRSTQLGHTYAPRPSDAEVQLYSVRVPQCAFEEISLVTAFADPIVLISQENAIEAAKRRARDLGGDAIVGLTDFPSSSDGDPGGIRGTVIRFADPSCRR